MRPIKRIIIHCSATREGVDFDIKDIDHWHKERGWNGCGYHYVIKLDGTIQKGRDIEKIGAHCVRHNKDSIGICYIGGLDEDGRPKDTRTNHQKAGMYLLIDRLKKRFPDVSINGHNEFANKDCPCFSVKDEFG